MAGQYALSNDLPEEARVRMLTPPFDGPELDPVAEEAASEPLLVRMFKYFSSFGEKTYITCSMRARKRFSCHFVSATEHVCGTAHGGGANDHN